MVTISHADVSSGADTTVRTAPVVGGRFELSAYSTAKAVRCLRTTAGQPGNDLVDAPTTRWGWS